MKMPESGKTGGKKVPAGKVLYHSPPNALRKKVGTGGLDQQILDLAEEYINTNRFDFKPHAEDILARLTKAVAAARKHEKADRPVIETITGPIMELKANGAMFRYLLVTEIADVMLGFLESITELNNDAFNIIDVHQRTLEAILKSGLTGGGGKEGRALAQELYGACDRYRKKYQIYIDG